MRGNYEGRGRDCWVRDKRDKWGGSGYDQSYMLSMSEHAIAYDSEQCRHDG